MIYNKIKYFLPCIFYFGSIVALKAQETFKGNFQLTDTISGHAEYNYATKNNTSIFVGAFKFNYSKKFNEVFRTLSYQGNFDENKKTGQWIFSSKNLVKSDSLNISDYQISYTASGFEYRVQGQFKDGKASGDWVVIEQNFKDATPLDTIFSANAVFENGKMINELWAKSQKMSLYALFDNDGMANGTWVIIHNLGDKIIEERRVYENGVFKNHFLNYNGETHQIEHLGLDTTKDEDEANWEIIDVRNQYFNIFELSNIGFKGNSILLEANDVKRLTHTANDFMERSITSFALKNNFAIWNIITNEQEIEFGKFKVRKYPYTKNEKQLVADIISYSSNISKTLNQFFNNPQIELGRLNFESLNRCYAVLEVYKNHLKEIDALAEKISNPVLEYLDRSTFVKSIAPNFNLGDSITYSFKEDTYSENHNFPTVPLNDAFNMESAHQFLKSIQQDLSSVYKEAAVVLNDLQKMEDLSDLETSFVQKRNEIQNRFNNSENDEYYNNFHIDFKDVVQAFSEQQFKSYAALSLDDKKQRIDDYLACFEDVLNLYDFLADLQIKINRLDETYIRTTFNPYLMVDMDERIKERLYNAYIDIALPYLLDKMKNEFECENIDLNTENIKNLINKMSQLRDEDTAVKERQLRRVKDALEVFGIIELDIN